MKKMEQFVSQDQHSYSLYFDLKIWFWAWKVSGTFGKRASENFLHSKQWRIQGRGRPFPSLFLDQTEQEILFGLIAKTRYRKLFFPNTPNTPAALAIFSEEAFIQVRVKSTEDLETNTSLTYNWMKEECDHLNNVLLLSWTDCPQQYWVSKKVISMHAWDGYTCRFSLGMADISPRSSPLRNVSWGRTSVTQGQKFHTDDVNQCLHNKWGSHGVSNANLFNFTFLLVDFGKVLCSSVNELQLNSNVSSREDYIPQLLAVLLEIHRVYIWPLGPFVFCLSFVNTVWNNEITLSTN